MYEPNHLDWPDCPNARDLGGMPTADGARIRSGALVRTDKHFRLIDAGIAAVRAYGVSRIIDLRLDHECDAQPSPFVGTPMYRQVAVQDPADPRVRDGSLSRSEIYIEQLDLRPELFTRAVREIIDAPDGAVVVHCAAGKDRTGLVIALALEAAGVEQKPIVADYAISEDRLRALSEAHLATIADPEEEARERALNRTLPETMEAVLSHLAGRYGGAVGYLQAGGLDADHLTALRRRLVG